MPKIDKYARDAEEWREDAEATYEAATLLFEQQMSFWFSASLLGHHALEMLLKSALIQAGLTIARAPRPCSSGAEHDAMEETNAWGHDLQELADLLASRRQRFAQQVSPHRKGLARFDSFFKELRYPGALRSVDSLGPGPKRRPS